MDYNFDEKLLTSEKSLWDIYLLSRKIGGSKIQNFIVLLVAVLLSVNAFHFESSVGVLLTDVRQWAEIGFSFSVTTLGFLIAGFTIFATLSKPDMMLAMMDHINKETQLPTLKYNFFTFMKVFIFYIVFSVIYLMIILFAQSGGLFSNLFEYVLSCDQLKIASIKIIYIVVGTSFIYLVLLLKGFVFNIYAIVMNFLRWEYVVNKSNK